MCGSYGLTAKERRLSEYFPISVHDRCAYIVLFRYCFVHRIALKYAGSEG